MSSNHWHMIENKKIPKLYADGNSGPDLRLAQTCGMIKPIDVIYSACNRGDLSSMLHIQCLSILRLIFIFKFYGI